MPNVSVIMPVYNTDKFIGEAIQSILSQSFSDFEFIIIDDCSTDGSYEICKKFAKEDKRIRLYRNEKNMGISFTRSKLIKLSTTNYIASQDSDDISFPDRLKLEYEFLENNSDFGAISGSNVIIDEEGNVIGSRKYSDEIEKTIFRKSPLSNPSSMFRKDYFIKIGGYDKNLDYGEDYDLWIKFFANGYKIKNIDENLIKYRIRDGQTKQKRIKETLRNTIFIQKRAIKMGLKPNFSDRIYHFLEKCLLILPNWLVLYLFKKIEYAKGK